MNPSVSPSKLSQDGPNGRARAVALGRAADAPDAQPTSLVGYRSTGRVLIVGPVDTALACARELRERIECVVLIEPGTAPAAEEGIVQIQAPLLRLGGHLGAFEAQIRAEESEVALTELLPGHPPAFDLILDLNAEPWLTCETKPVGYYAPGTDTDALRAALAELPEMIGEFEKPRFFNYDPDICTHGNSGMQGCTRCLDVCPTQAIQSLVDRIEVDPYLCQGAGSCATACPAGAITYAYPAADDLLSRLRVLLTAYREVGGEGAELLFHDAEAGGEVVAQQLGDLPETVIPFEVAEVGSVGMEIWLAGLAYGAGRVSLLTTSQTPPSVVKELQNQLAHAQVILDGLGYDPQAIRLLDAVPHEDLSPALCKTAATFAGFGGKREVFRLALEHLHRYAPAPREAVELAPDAPFGEIRVDREACTLCMACVSVCPASALQDGTDLPLLGFNESKCVQCGLCAKACPEDAVVLHPRLAYAEHLAPAQRVLNEDAPFNCVVCGKPFATRRMMDRIAGKLSGHWMFQDDKALERLQMCEDCRLHDIFAGSGGLEVYDKSG